MSVVKARGKKGKEIKAKLAVMVRASPKWTDAQDERLVNGVLAGGSFADLARAMDVTRGAAIGRFNRLRSSYAELLADGDEPAVAAKKLHLTPAAGQVLFDLICRDLGEQAV